MDFPCFQKLKALLKKNIILMKRNIFVTLLEIFLPIIMFILMILIRKTFKIESETFETKEKDMSNFLNTRAILSSLGLDEGLEINLGALTNFTEFNPNFHNYHDLNFDYKNFNISNINNFKDFIKSINITEFSLKYLGINLMIPPLYICSQINIQGVIRPLIASVGLPTEIKNRMIFDSILYNKMARLYYMYNFNPFPYEFDFELNKSSFKEFETIEDMENYIKDEEYINKKNDICFGVSFSHDNDINNYNYSLHFFDFDKIGNEGIRDISSSSKGMFDKFQIGPDLESYKVYTNGAFNYMMKIINEYILRKETGNSKASLSYAVLPMKFTDYRFDMYGQYFGYIISIVIIVAYMFPISLYVYKMVGEKESRIKEGMKIMGLGETEYFFSYFIQYFIISIFVSFINSVIFKKILASIPLYFIYFVIFLFSLNIFSLIYFFQSFIDKTRIAIVLSLVLYFIMYCLSLACMFEETSFKIKSFLSIFPPVNLNLGILLFSKFEYHFKKFKNTDFTIRYINYSLFDVYISFIIDFFLYLFLGYYFHNVLPHDFGIRKPWYFLCSKGYWYKNKNRKFYNFEEKLEFGEFNTQESNLLEEEKENYIDQLNIKYRQLNEEINNKNENDVFEIRNLVKIFDDGKKAVNGINLNFYKDEIFALLGQNGAGKTTFISMLTGMYESTEGKAIYNGYNILDSNNIDIFREKLGICPQHDILFEDLNVREHLEMFAIFKGCSEEKMKIEVSKSLNDFQINDIQYTLARNLSGGQRRKLSIAISLIGGSQIIFLDEPSSGMDIVSRRNLWKILKNQCEGKIIILTTHYMEEASSLGKRIGFISEGKMKCIGSPFFLIDKYGKYMSVNVIKEENADDVKIISFVQNQAKNIKYEILSEEIMFRIPVKDDENSEKFEFSKFFKNLDENINELKIKSYNVSMPTLEDVFLNVATEENKKAKEEKEKELLIQIENTKILLSTDIRESFSKKEKFKNDFLINMKRRFLITIRDFKGLLIEVFGPILLVLLGLGLSHFEINIQSKPYQIGDLSVIGKQKIIFSSLGGNKYNEYLEEDPLVIFEEINFNNNTNRKIISRDFIEKVYNITYKYEENINYEVDMINENYIGYYASLLMFSDNSNQYEFLMLLNARVKQTVPIYTHYFLKSLIQNECKKRGKNVTINYTHYPMPVTIDVKEQTSMVKNIAIIFFVSIAFGMLPVNFVSILVKERTNNSKHLMKITGLNMLSYWAVNYIFEFIKYYFTAGICLYLLYIYGFYRKYLYILYLTYGPGMISLTYAISLFFENESNAQIFVILLNFILGDLGSIVILGLRTNSDTLELGKKIEYILALVPSFCFDFSFNLLLNQGAIFIRNYYRIEYTNFKGDEMIKHFNLMLVLIIFSSLECIIYTILFIIIEYRSYLFKKPKDKILLSEITDDGVKKEIKKVNTKEEMLLPYENKNKNNVFSENIINSSINENNLVVKVRNLQKIYGNECLNQKKNIAIKNLNFCVGEGECFGLLGLNGAGKTTTFKCITQEISHDNGEIFIYGKDINGKYNELNKLVGYCPQFNAIFENLTVYENLEFYAIIKGIKKSYIKQLVTFMIVELSLTEFTNKISGNLSGGNKRKLSVAISMIGNPPIILLDEPSTGMDPEARRFMWSVIHKMSTNGRKSSVILTTNSMDEAESLCKRIGIMINGELVCLGTSNEIKEKYGYGYEANVRIRPMTQTEQKNILDKFSLDYILRINNENIYSILNKLGKESFIDEFKQGRMGEKIQNKINVNGSISIEVLLNFIFFVENVFKFIKCGKKYFEQIILSEFIENNFLFKLKKGKDNKSIGFFFGLFEENKNECNVEEYSFQKSSLEQIFNKFAHNQRKQVIELKVIEKIGIIIDDDIFNKFNI